MDDDEQQSLPDTNRKSIDSCTGSDIPRMQHKQSSTLTQNEDKKASHYSKMVTKFSPTKDLSLIHARQRLRGEEPNTDIKDLLAEKQHTRHRKLSISPPKVVLKRPPPIAHVQLIREKGLEGSRVERNSAEAEVKKEALAFMERALIERQGFATVPLKEETYNRDGSVNYGPNGHQITIDINLKREKKPSAATSQKPRPSTQGSFKRTGELPNQRIRSWYQQHSMLPGYYAPLQIKDPLMLNRRSEQKQKQMKQISRNEVKMSNDQLQPVSRDTIPIGLETDETLRESEIFHLQNSVISSPATNESLSPKMLNPTITHRANQTVQTKHKSSGKLRGNHGYSQFRVSQRRHKDKSSHAFTNSLKQSNMDKEHRSMRLKEDPRQPQVKVKYFVPPKLVQQACNSARINSTQMSARFGRKQRLKAGRNRVKMAFSTLQDQVNQQIHPTGLAFMEAATNDSGLRNLCVITGTPSIRQQWADQQNGRRLLDWASQNIDNLARAARAASTLQHSHQKSSPSKIQQQPVQTEKSNNGDDSRSNESAKESDQRRSVVLSRHSHQQSQARAVRGIKFDSVKNFLENRKGSRRGIERPAQVQSSGGLRYGCDTEERSYLEPSNLPYQLIVMNDQSQSQLKPSAKRSQMYTLTSQKDKSFIEGVHVPPVTPSSIANRSGSIKARQQTELSIRPPPSKSFRTVQSSAANNIFLGKQSKRTSQNNTPHGERVPSPKTQTNFDAMKNWVVYKGTKYSRALDLCKPLFFDQKLDRGHQYLGQKKNTIPIQEVTLEQDISKNSIQMAFPMQTQNPARRSVGKRGDAKLTSLSSWNVRGGNCGSEGTQFLTPEKDNCDSPEPASLALIETQMHMEKERGPSPGSTVYLPKDYGNSLGRSIPHHTDQSLAGLQQKINDNFGRQPSTSSGT